ncbi:vWA domain-containing protein [uncultured Tateyamaria sp.]|uniref:vWA domain-containing protein n=1 Tax=uncultured Tateyamaria sp. TaxID=455651 RepID=UPI002622ECEB|nr:vWA domain-containing protein [uncultured Tateyamaria sp.]
MRCTGQKTAALAGILSVLLANAAQANCTEDAMIVFDGSGSMAEMGFNQIDEPRIFEARRAIRTAMPQVAPFRRIGLIVYGPGGAGGVGECSGIELRFGPRADAAGPIIAAVDGLQPEGRTALTEAVALAAKTLGAPEQPGTVVLVTDGKETCGGQTCTLAAQLAGTGTTVHVIGFKVRGEHFGWETEGDTDYLNSVSVARCLADQTGGEYVNTETVNELVEAMNRTLGCKLLF